MERIRSERACPGSVIYSVGSCGGCRCFHQCTPFIQARSCQLLPVVRDLWVVRPNFFHEELSNVFWRYSAEVYRALLANHLHNTIVTASSTVTAPLEIYSNNGTNLIVGSANGREEGMGQSLIDGDSVFRMKAEESTQQIDCILGCTTQIHAEYIEQEVMEAPHVITYLLSGNGDGSPPASSASKPTTALAQPRFECGVSHPLSACPTRQILLHKEVVATSTRDAWQ